jgi:hypothetical protein
MHPLAIGKTYCLRLPDGRPLGHVQIAWIEDYWAGGAFAAGAAFEEFRPLFEREAELRKDQIIPLWEEAADDLESLHVQVVEDGVSDINAGVRIRVEGNEAFLGAPLPVLGLESTNPKGSKGAL